MKTTTPENCIARTAEFFVNCGQDAEDDKTVLNAIKELPVEALASWLIDTHLGCYFCPGCNEAPENSCELGVVSGLNNEQDINKLADMVEYDGYYYKNAYIPESKEELIALINGKVPLDRINIIKITDMSRLFAYTNRDDYSGIETWDTRNVTDMSYMFYCANASSPTIAGIANWNTSKVVNMSSMFAYSDFDCDISKWDVSNVSNMSSMFYACPFSYDISNWNIKSLAIAKQMFDKKYKHSLVKWFINDSPEPSIVNSLNTYFGADIVKDDKDGK